MIKVLICILLQFCLLLSVQANIISACDILQKRLNHINDLYVRFNQHIYSSGTELVNMIQGEVWLKRPNLFHCHVINPEECFLISDGKNIWFYTPYINQVTIYYTNSNIFNNIFFKFLSRNISVCKDYVVTQKNDWFYLSPIDCNQITLQECKIKINHHGVISCISFIQENGQNINYDLSNHNTDVININKFIFIINNDMQIDDQRN